mmetsp:Transcript_39885/g.105373  ORF Transcript_39885/g.105373 Transcript_39885/m.105373 type:complete len:178 (-) Transcript_39885:207-740(-)
MGGHLDDAERCQTVPIVSISLGLDAIYLIGGRTKAQEPIPLLLRSGDVILQGGESRQFVHGVPRVIAGSLPTELSEFRFRGDAVLAPVASWLDSHRININVRQCWALGEGPLSSSAAVALKDSTPRAIEACSNGAGAGVQESVKAPPASTDIEDNGSELQGAERRLKRVRCDAAAPP